MNKTKKIVTEAQIDTINRKTRYLEAKIQYKQAKETHKRLKKEKMK